jgi:hypothetical protein
MRTRFLLLCSSLLPALAIAQSASHLSPRVMTFVREDAPTIVLAHVRVIDGTGGAARADQSVVIRDGKIVAVGDAASTKVPDGAKVLDLTGRSVIPGLVGMHDHMYYPAPLGPPAIRPFERRAASSLTPISNSRKRSTLARAPDQKSTSPALISKAPAHSLRKCTNSKTRKTRAAPRNTGLRKA